MNGPLWSLVSLIGGAGWVVSLLQVKMKNRKLNIDSVKVLTETATGLVGKVKAELEETEADAKALRAEVKELNRQLGEAHLLVDDLNQKLEATQRRADYYESEYRRVTGLKKRGS